MRFSLRTGPALALALALAGCGGGDDSAGDGLGDGEGTPPSQRVACDIGAGTDTHYCYEWAWNGPANAADAYTGVCGGAGAATTVTSCPSAGKVGGCKYTVTNNSVTVTWTGWFYFGDVADHMMSCMSAGGVTATWVNP